MSVLSLDYETRSTVDLTKTGVYPYAEHKHTGIWCMAWAFDDEEPALWVPGEDLPERIIQHIEDRGEMRAWNAQFERIIWREVMPRYFDGKFFVQPRLEQWVCSAAEAAAMALPRSLGNAAKVLGVEAQKDKKGAEVMLRLCRPRAFDNDGEPIWWDDAGRIQILLDYCKQDVRTERSIIKVLRRLSPREREVYILDQKMNDRGLRCDLDLVRAAQDVAFEGADRANKALVELTGGAVKTVTNHGAIKKWVNARGVEASGVSKDVVRDLLDGELPEDVRAALVLRSDAGRSSVAKLANMLSAVCEDGRLRGMLLYHAASTGRWAGRGVQPHNFPRGEVPDVESFIPAVLERDYASIDLLYHPTIVVLSMLRSMMTAAPDKVLIAADYSAIEARVLNWLAGQEDVLEYFRAYDAGDKSKDPYVQNAMKLYKLAFEEIEKFPHRQTGKFQELGCGFQMGARKAVEAAKAQYGLTITDEEASAIVKGYRSTHGNVVQFWYDTEDACKQAVLNPGVPVTFGALRNLKAIKAGAYLYVILPSGRPLCYASPKIVEAETPWSKIAREEAEIERDRLRALGYGEEFLPEVPAIQTKPSLEFSSVERGAGGWGRERTYGGKLVENIVQATARDMMAEGMLRAESEGFPVVLTVHDEVVAEIEETETAGYAGDRELVKRFENILTTLPSWADGCPVAAEGWLGFRYRK